MSNGDTQTVIPGQAPGTTPPILPSPQNAAAPIDEQTKKILATLIQNAQRKQFAGQPHPSPIPAGGDMNAARSIGMNTGNPHAWSAQRLMAGIAASIKSAVSKSKEQQVMKAEADWQYASSALNELYAAQASGDKQAEAAAQKKVDLVFGDPKKLKNMAKALNQDWLNPEKTTVYGEALKKVAAQTQQTSDAKQKASSGIKGIFQKLLQRKQQPQLDDSQKNAMSKEITAKAPIATGALDINSLKSIADFEKAVSAAKEKYQYIPANDGSGTVWAFNKNDSKDAHMVRDSETGQAIKVGKAPAKEGQVYTVNGVPLGVFHGGKPMQPGDEGWSDADAKLFMGAVEGVKEKQALRVDPIIAAQVGDPPMPKDFKKGRSDPEYAAALAAWGKKAEGIKNQMAGASGEARAKAFNEYRPVQVMDADGNVYYTTAKSAIEQGQSGAGEGIKLKPREAQIKDIQVASKSTREAINNLDRDFTPAQIAKLHYAMETEDLGLANTELSTLATQDLTEKQQDFVIWVRQLNERAMSLRNVAGMGTGAQDLRTAIRAMIPGIRSGDKKMMNKQLDAFDNQVSILKTGIAHPGKTAPKDKKDTPDTGTHPSWFHPATPTP
jgi:hypothetical protein